MSVLGLGSALAAASVVSAFALQSDTGTTGEGRRPAVTSSIADEPIRYAGGYGLYPNIR